MIECGRRHGKGLAVLAFWATAAGIYCSFVGFPVPKAYAAGSGFYLARQRGPSKPLLSVSVDRRGFVWSAGPGGACRFDGLTTRCVSDESALLIGASNASDDVWAVFANGTLRQISPARPQRTQWRVPGLATALLVVEGSVWVSSTSGLFVLDERSQQQSLRAVSTGPVQSITSVEGGPVLALMDGRILRFDAPLRAAKVVSHDIRTPVIRLSAGAGGGWLAATAHEIWRAAKGKPGFARAELTTPNTAPPLALMGTADGAVWVGAAGGLFHLPAGADETIEVRGLPFASPGFAVTALAPSEANRVWLATPVGLYEVQSQFPSTTLNHQVGTDIAIAFAVAPAARDGVWFSSGKGINLLSSSGLRGYGVAEGLKSPDLRAVAVDRQGDIWAGGLESGLYKLDSVQQRFVPQTAVWSGGIRAILASREGGLWLGLSGSGLVRVDRSRPHVLLPPAAEGANEVLDMLEDRDGSLWITFRGGGLAIVRQGVLDHFPLPPSARGVEFLSLLEDGEGGVLLGSNGKGLFRLTAGAMQQVTMLQGLAADHIFGLTTDREGRIWFSSPHGLSYAPRSDVLETLNGMRRSFHSVSWGREEGITGEPIRAFPKSAATLSDGTLAFPALDGLIRIDPALIRAVAPPEVVLDPIDFGAGGVNHDLPAGIQRFRSHRAQIRFAFAAPKHPRRHRLRFRFRLLGLETAWRVESGTGEARYAGVPPGTYHFEVQADAAKEDGGPSAVVSATVEILPPWYSTWVFRVLALVFAAAGMFWRHRVRTARSAALLDAKAAERRRIAADIHDGLTQDLVGLRLQIEAAQASLHKDPSTAGTFLHRARLLLEDGLKDLRDSIWGLNHDDVDSDSLADGLRERLDRSTRDTAVSLSFESVGVRWLVAPAVAWQITQIAREAVANAIKHSAASHIAVTLSASEHSITLSVADDGRGIDGAAAHPGVGRGFGLAGMQARAEGLGAVLQIRNGPSGGTRLELIIPRSAPPGGKRPPG